MSVPLIVNGVTFQYPVQFDKNWGPTLTGWSTAVTNGMLQKAGGSFTLTSEVDFGAAFGIALAYIKSKGSNIAASGFLRLENASSGIVWRNAANNADLPLTVNSSNQLTFNGISVGATTSLTNSHILVGNASNQPADVAMSGDITITNTGVTAIGAGKIVDAQINSSAAIALTKLASTAAYAWHTGNISGVLAPVTVTASRAVVTDANGLPSASATTATEIGFVSGLGSAVQTQINGLLPKSGGTMTGILNMGGQRIASVGTPTTSGDVPQYPITPAQMSSTTKIGAYRSISQNYISGNNTIVIFDTTEFDGLSEYNTSTGQVTIVSTGYYLVSISVDAGLALTGNSYTLRLVDDTATLTLSSTISTQDTSSTSYTGVIAGVFSLTGGHAYTTRFSSSSNGTINAIGLVKGTRISLTRLY